ncbi:MAG: beta-propeller domain-containing protein [Bacilli bacterium]
MKKILFLMLLMISLLMTGCTIGNRQDPVDLGLSTVTDANDLKNLLKVNNNKYYPGGIVDDAIGATNGNPQTEFDSDTSYRSNDYTKTNVQVEGVDEGDIMKTDGSRIYSISWDRMQVIKLLGDGQMELLLNEQITSANESGNYHSYTYYSELYVTNHYLIVIGQKYEYYITYYKEQKDDAAVDGTDEDDKDVDIMPIYPYYYRYTSMTVVDIYDIETLVKKDSYQVSGYNQGSRLIEDKLYLISNHYAPYYALTDEEYDVRPWYIHNGEATFFDYESIKYLPDTVYESFTIISTFDLDPETIGFDNDVFLASQNWSQIYVSKTSIYLASNFYTQNLLGIYEQRGLLVSYQFDEVTGEVFYGGSGTFNGYVINQFAMDEYNGFMRIATTDGWWGESVKNRLYVFERKVVDEKYVLETVALIDEGLGKPGERIQSVRFNEDLATIVTFLRTDPFYTVDLSDPYNPIIAGELEIPGFSTYQHPWTEDLIIGIGFDAVDGITTGMKISLYDVSDIANPVEVGKPLVLSNGNSSWTYSEATYNHKAIMIDKTRNCFGFSLYRYNWSNSYYTSMNDYVIFDVDETRETPIQVKHSISHIDYYNDYANLYTYYWYYDFQIKRAFRVDDFLYVLSGEVVTSHNLLGDLSVVDEIIYQQFYVTK